MTEAFVCGGYAGTGCLWLAGAVGVPATWFGYFLWQHFGVGTKTDDDKRGRA